MRRIAVWLAPAAVFATAALVIALFVDGVAGRGVADVRPLIERLPLLCAGAAAGGVFLPDTRARIAGLAGGVLLTIALPLDMARAGGLEWAPVIAGYAGVALVAATFGAIAECMCAHARDRLSACVLTVVGCLAVYTAGPGIATLARGVVDGRDVIYYASCAGLFGFVAWRLRRDQRGDVILAVAAAAGVIAINAGARGGVDATWDTTGGKRQSLSAPSRAAIGQLRFDVRIFAFVSADTHPALARAAQQLRDVLAAYRLAGGGRLRVTIRDPGLAPKTVRRLADRYGALPFPVELADGRVVRVWFSVVVASEHQHQHLDALELTTRRGHGAELEVRLRNVEYSVTTALRNVSGARRSLRELLAQPGPEVTLSFYVSPGEPPQELAGFGARLGAVGRRLQAAFPRRFRFRRVRVADPAVEKQLLDWGVRPIAVSERRAGYFHPVVRIAGGEPRLIVPDEHSGSARIRRLIAAELRRARRRRHWVGVAGSSLDQLYEQLSRSYRVSRLSLEAPVPDGVRVLLVRDGGDVSAHAARYIEAFLARGGSVIAFAAGFRAVTRGGLELVANPDELRRVLASRGIRVAPTLVVDDEACRLRFPVIEPGASKARIYELTYPMFVRVPARRMPGNLPFGRELDGVVAPWASPLELTGDEGLVLARASAAAAAIDRMAARPDLTRYPGRGFPVPPASARRGAFGLVVVAGRLVVIASSEFVSDSALLVARQLAVTERLTDNLAFVHAAIDWALDGGAMPEIPDRKPPPALAAPGPGWYVASFAILVLMVVLLPIGIWSNRRVASILRR